jgi:hypothetical protein
MGMSGPYLDRTQAWFVGLVEAALKREQIRVAQILSVAANEQCSCGGAGPDDPGACPACLYYHRVRALLGPEWEAL